MRPLTPLLETSTWRVTETSEASDLDVQHLAATIEAVLRIDAMRAESAAVGRIFGHLGSFESVGGAAISAAAFGLFAFRISHLSAV